MKPYASDPSLSSLATQTFQALQARTFHTVLALALGLGLAPLVQADKPEWAGGGKGHKGERAEHREPEFREQRGTGVLIQGPSVQVRIGGYFGEQQRVVVYQDYGRQIRSGHCPPGLAKKGPDCLPPGQAKKAYVLGQPLPPTVTFYELPPQVAVRLGAPPAGHRFVRVAADILLIAVGTGMVIDAIEDLGR